jgi:hypothetical protein
LNLLDISKITKEKLFFEKRDNGEARIYPLTETALKTYGMREVENLYLAEGWNEVTFDEETIIVVITEEEE